MPEGNHHGNPNMSKEEQKARIQQEINIANNMSHIKHKIVVMSGKGGVGKSTVAANIAETFAKKGYKTGILDVDIHGPNIPKLFGKEGQVLGIEDNKILPVMSDDNVAIMSMGFLLDSQDTPIIWRGPQKTGVIRQFISDVKWGNLDVLIIDNPPGTGDEPLTVLQTIPEADAVVMVTTPNSLSQEDVLKCVTMAKKMNIKQIGLVENMAYFECPHCGEKINIFGKNQGENFAKLMDIDYLGDIPLTEEVSNAVDEDTITTVEDPKNPVSKEFKDIVEKIEDKFFKKDE
ncbi:MAG: Mrp/NBP35 family ATP-binding protein [Methanobrevibacter boviskoreani]|jgi:ATP-binding protein involved in chromosome partitioning|uniref:Mrp/NBP35 family ATP-binding protein n=1 Tax=Methanobrevibacter boviskoreani TaxID=1348249 RepID=UPI000593FB60|nr:Mrp/NBP35 family ATP-binding protein [Methanobrevibacter boviskoreani]MCI6929845.1 Mrp/NBP35 family ATP-binding protein [Methanobrevibacter boviskoreani]MDD6256613.1 Mrp/NBP35 family ATP-binding protein [Methanobrevibacter boviskoreani]MDY5614251.1 Mrp/NBP35 family ATP-binding protein [Methanobrevibacter boviskoreani]